MAYDHSLETTRARLLAVIGVQYANLHINEIWDRYLTVLGVTGGALLDRLARAAILAQQPLPLYIKNGGGLSAEIAPVVGSGAGYTLSGTTPPTHDGTGIHFVGSEGLAAATASVSTGVILNDRVHRIEFTIANRSAGTFRVLVYADNTAHLAATNPEIAGTANGNFVVYKPTSQAGSNFREVRIQCQTGPCTGDITFASVKRVL